MEVKKEFNPYHTKGSVVYGRIKTFFLGKEKPRLFTRINAVIAFVYLF